MHARIVAAAQGAGWLATGWRLFRVAPVAWLAATLAYWFVISALSLVPLLGGAVALVLMPAFTVGFMSLARAAEHGAALDLRLLFDGFRHRPGAQLALGVAYFAGLAAVLAASTLADDGQLARWVLGGRRPAPEMVDGEPMFVAATVAALAYLPVMAAFWFAPPLVAWHSAGVAKALFFSFFACLLNWRPFLAYGAVSAFFALALPLAVLFVLMMASFKVAAMSLVFPLLLVLLPTLFASFYASYRDIFGVEAQ
jgi:hypothetical protein